MVKIAAMAVAAVLVAALGLYMAGFRVALDGSGMMPRFVNSVPDYDALEADRARQRALPSPAPDPPTAPIVAAARDAEQRRVPEAPDAGQARAEDATPGGRRAPAVWPDFRGAARDGRSGEPILTDWPAEGLRLLWKQPVGLGYASFVVADGRAFTIEQRRSQEVAAAYDVNTGRELWTHGWEGEFVESMGGDGPRATPTWHNGRLYVLGALGELRALDAATGRLLWRRNILDDAGASNLDWGMSAAPLIVDEKVVVLPGGSRGRSIAAYHQDTGDLVWRALDDRQAYTSPMLVTIGGVRQILVVTATRAVGVTPDNGTLLWEYPWATDMGINVAQPVLLGGDRVFLSASYGQGAAVFEVARAGSRFTTRTIWENNRMKNKFTSSVLHDGHLYGLDESILTCVDAATGDVRWKAGRYGYGQLVWADGHLIVITEDGDLVLVRATPERHDELARFPAIDGKTWNHPVVADGRLLVRNIREMAAFDIRPGR